MGVRPEYLQPPVTRNWVLVMAAGSPPVSTMQKLLDAIDRLFAGQPTRSDGSLTMSTLAVEAGVSRGTLYRHPEAGREFERRLAERQLQSDLPETMREQVRALRVELAAVRAERWEELVELRETVKVYANRIQRLTLEAEELRARAGVRSIRPSS